MSDQNAPANLDDVCRSRLSQMWAHAGFADVEYPVATADVLKLLDACDYRADHDFLLDLMNRGILTVPRVNGHRAWRAEDVMRVTIECEGRRRWKWPSSVHGMKFTQSERAQAEAEAAGRASCFHDLDELDIESLLIHMTNAEQHSVRDMLRVAALAKCKEAGVL